VRRLSALAVATLALTSSCFLRGSSGGAADELSTVASEVSGATYAAIYRYELTGPLAPAVRTRMEVIQDPPVSVRKLEIATPDKEGKPVTVRSWQVRNANGDYACTDYERLGIRCVANPIARGTFGSAQIDEYFDFPREPSAFVSVRKATRPVRLLGEEGMCFEAIPAPPTPPPIVSPQPTVSSERFRYELCYADDGILLRARRTILEDVEGSTRREALVEAVSISRVVEPRELRLPGPIASAEDLRS
jgi:hypothetical protein